MPEDLVSIYESEFYIYYLNSPFAFPLGNALREKKNVLDEICVHFLT
jgi:hypothetical protein